MKIKVINLENGGTVIYLRNKKLNQTVVNLGFRVNKIERKYYGLYHFLEHMLFKGTHTKNNEQFFETRIELCPTLNASTSLDLMHLSFYRTNKMIEQSFDLVADIIFNAKLDPKEIEKEKDVMLKELKLSTDKREANVSVANRTTIADDKSFIAYSIDKILGTEEIIRNVTQKKLVDLKNKFFVKQNFICCVTTSLSKKKMLNLIKSKVYNHLPDSQDQHNESVGWVANKRSQVRVVSHSRENRFSYILTFVLEKDLSKNLTDYNHNYAASILRKKIYFKLREHGYIYSCNVTLSKEISQLILQITVQTIKEKFNESLDVICDTINDLKSNLVNKDMIEYIKNNYIYSEDETQPVSHTKRNLSRLYTFMHYNNFFKTDRKTVIRQIKACNAESIKKAFNEIFSTDKVYLTILGADLKKEDYPTIKELKKKFK